MVHPVPLNETARRQAVADLTAGRDGADPIFARASRLAAALFDAPMAAVTLLTGSAQHLTGAYGVEAGCADRDAAFCNHTILADAPFVIPDTAADPRFAGNPLVTDPPHIRFYAGAPLVTAAGLRLGAVCVLDRTPRPAPDAATLARLRDIADMVVDLLTAQRPSGDGATGADAPPVEELESAKAAFVQLVSHELRTPLNAVLGFSDLMAGEALGPLPAPYGDYAGWIQSSARHLLGVVNNVLTLANVQRGEMHLDEATVGPEALVDRACHLVGPELARPEVTVVRDIAADAPALYVDPAQTAQMLAHLLSNAQRFGGPAPRIGVGYGARADATVAFTVRDDGPGLPPECETDALAPFRQVENGQARNNDGMGLGLPLTQKLAALHGGWLEIDSGRDAGTAVAVVFPRWRVRPALRGATAVA